MSLQLAWHLLDVSNREDRRRERRRHNFVRRQKYDAFKIPEREFIKTYRLRKELVLALINDITPLIPRERRRDSLSVKDKLLITLSFYATGSYQTLVGQSIYSSVSQPTVSRAVNQVTKALNNPQLFKKYVFFPTSRGERDIIKRNFYDKTKIPGVVGCIDGTHVAIVRPIHHEERYFNRKGYHSLNVMIVCDSDLNILCIDPSSPGSSHDSVVWRYHPLHDYLKQKYNDAETMYFLGDSGYPLRRTMMTPYLNAADGTPEAYYYNMQVSARNVVERCIGVLKSRFRCLLVARKLHYDPITAGQIVKACAILHNMANRARLAVPNLSEEDRRIEMERQIQLRMVEQHLRDDIDNSTGAAINQSQSRGNIELLHGRMAQQALIQRLWAERNA